MIVLTFECTENECKTKCHIDPERLHTVPQDKKAGVPGCLFLCNIIMTVCS